jgi:hypothetical protein
MAYIGSKPNDTRQLARREFSYAVTVASTTTFTGSDAGGKTLSYQPGELEVYMNGVRLDPADYTATTGSSVVLGSGANIGDNINIFAGQILPTDDYVSKAAGGTFDGNLLVGMTTASTNNDGAGIRSDGLIHAKRADVVATFNRKTSDGTIVELAKDNTVVGSIGVNSGDLVIHSTAASHVGLIFGNTRIEPSSSTGSISDGTVDLGNTNPRFKDAYLSGGVYLGGTGSANKLDDYETGSFTPAFVSTTVDPTISYNQRFGRYTKIGNTVYVYLYIKVTTASGGSGNVNITGLPFNNSSNSPISEGNSFQFNYYQNTNLSSGRVLAGYFRNNDNKIYCTVHGGASSTAVYPVSDLTTNNNLIVYGSGTYTVSS